MENLNKALGVFQQYIISSFQKSIKIQTIYPDQSSLWQSVKYYDECYSLFQNQQNQLYKLYSTVCSLTQRHTTTCKQVAVTLNMVNCFKDYRRYIHILNHILHLASFRYLKLTPKQQYILPVLLSQYHVCWCSGDFRSRSIIRHGIDPPKWNILSPSSEQLRYWHGRQTLYDLYHICFCVYSVL